MQSNTMFAAQMEDFDYDRKFNEMQKYIPFLDRVIVKLKNDDPDKPRKAQLDKMQTLQSLLNNKQKKLKIETLLKCESVLKKLHAKIEQSDELKSPKTARKPSTSKIANESSAGPDAGQQTESKDSSVKNKPKPTTSASENVPKRGDLQETNTCPASPPHLGDEDFHPPVEIPTERRGSPVTNKQWDQRPPQKEHIKQSSISGYNNTFPNRSADYYQNQNSNKTQQQLTTQDRKRSHSRWSDFKDMGSSATTSNSSSYQRTWTSSSSSTPANNHRSYTQQRNESKSIYMSEEENWDDPDDLLPPTPSNPIASTLPSYGHQNKHHHHYERSNKHRSISNLVDVHIDDDEYQKKLYYDTIFKYKKPDPPPPSSNPFMNPPAPDRSDSPGSVFNRLGESRVGRGFENFRIEVKNDKMKSRHQKTISSPQPQLSPVVPIKPIDEVLKSPPLSADDIDDLMNEAFEAATTRPNKPLPTSTPIPAENEVSNDRTALELVRRKLALISRSSPSELDVPSPTSMMNMMSPSLEPVEKEPFYRRGQTPVKKIPDVAKYNTEPSDSFKNVVQSLFPESTPSSVTQPPENVVEERLALKYHPHRKRDPLPETQNLFLKSDVSDILPNHNTVDPMADRLAMKYNPHPRKEPVTSNIRVTDPRVGKILGHSTLGTPSIPVPAVAPIPNVLPTINPFDPRLRNSRLTSIDAIPAGTFCPPLPSPRQQIPNLLEMNLMNPLTSDVVKSSKNPFNITPRIDPRKQKPSAIYADKFNPERNDQTERMKYLESKKKKAPEPKTYGEYKQSKCRQQAAEEAAKNNSEINSTSLSSNQLSSSPATPSSLDKMYRNADYRKEMGGNIHSFKIPKKPKTEDSKSEDVKKIEVEPTKTDDTAKVSEDASQKLEKPAEKVDESKTKAEKSKKNEKTKVDMKKEYDDESSLNESKESNQEQETSPKESDADDTPKPVVKRRRGRPPMKVEVPSPALCKEESLDESQKEQEEEIRPVRISTRRSTVLKDSPERDLDEKDESSSASNAHTRSASEIFSPSTDNSIVSTQNIITGKRRTRASINFSEKSTKKAATPKATPTPSPATTPKLTGPKMAGKKTVPTTISTRTRKQTNGKQTADDGQICAVSSTTSQGGDESLNDNTNGPDDTVSQEEPTSSGNKAPAIDAEENQKKQEWLEGFLKSIVDPATNKDRILDMLKAVLDEKKLEQVKAILYSSDDESRNETADAKKPSDAGKCRAPRTKKNELDRLNEDIRDMFICQGVVTATGRRMCTLAKESTKEKTPKTTPKEPVKEKKARAAAGQSSRNASPAQIVKRTMRKAKVVISPLNMRALRSRNKKDDRPLEMPVLEPNTPIKLSEEDDDDDEEQDTEPIEGDSAIPKTKISPKSKRSQELYTDADADDDTVLHNPLKNKIKSDIENDEQIKEKSNDEEPQVVSDVEDLNDEIDEEQTDSKEKNKTDIESLEPVPKNTNPEWHTMSDYASCCVICKDKSRFIAPHYLTAHNDSEVYTSRLPPVVLEDLKNNVNNRALYSVPKKPSLTAFHYRCPFCDFQATSTLRAWMEHFTIHTGEYQYKCSNCFKAMNGCTHLVEHIRKTCPDAKRINREPVNLRGNMINGYICHLCHYVQMLHSGVVKHLKIHHGLDDDESVGRIWKVKLIDSNDVPKMEEGSEPTETKSKSYSTPTTPQHPIVPSESNMDVFLSRELASPTSDVLTERLKSIDQEDRMNNDSNTDVTSSFKNGEEPIVRMTIAERLSQRFKNIEKEQMESLGADLDRNEENADGSSQEERPSEDIQESYKQSGTIAMEIDDTVPDGQTVLPDASVDTSALNVSLNESGNLVIDEQAAVDDNASESEWGADDNDEDDNENWEDIEITETKGTSHKDRNKNKSIFQTLSRLYASIAPKKAKRYKDREKRRTDQTEHAIESSSASNSTYPSTANPSPAPEPAMISGQTIDSTSVPASAPSSESERSQEARSTPTLAAMRSSVSAQLPAAGHPQIPAQISNLSDLLPDLPGDSLDELLSTNFNCLEGYGTSFPQLDLNDFDSPIFLLPEDQSNIQDAIALATDLDHINHDDVLGNNLPPPPVSVLPPPVSVLAPPVQQVQSGSSAQRVGNFGFSLSGESLRYYCMVADCTFLFSDHPDGLQNHFLLEHPTLQWNGYCHTCQAQAEEQREMQHVLEVHSKIHLVQQQSEKPRIKFRRLTGDILSTGKDEMPFSTTPPPLDQPPVVGTTEFSLSTLLLSGPKAMIQPKPPTGFVADIPLYKNVSKDFAITSVAEGVSDQDLTNLVLNQAQSTPGGMQISQVVSLNTESKSQSPCLDQQVTNLITSLDQCGSSTQHSKSNSPTPQITTTTTTTTTTAATSISTNFATGSNPSPKATAFKCCANNCLFSTNLRTDMHEHIQSHMRADKDRGSLKCYQCLYAAKNINDYFQHMSFSHVISKTTAPGQATNDLTQKIQDILRTNRNNSCEEPKVAEAATNDSESFVNKLKMVAEETVADTGTTDLETWKCPLFKECPDSISEDEFLVHVAKHISYAGKNQIPILRCPHCTVSYQRPTVLRAHIKTHSRHRYFCYLCCRTFASFPQSQKHVNDVHTRCIQVHSQPLIPNGKPEDSSFEVFSTAPLTSAEILQFGEKLISDYERKKALNKTHFRPHEHYLLPLQPIFNNQVFCSVCNYKTKVRTNMLRHLQLHRQEVNVASVDPVNPVPCLEKNEKHFDKMLNLACSSNATGGSAAKPKDNSGIVKIPAFIPDMRRFVCGHPGCTYLTITDGMLRSHLNALHSGEKGYQCPHCQEDICKKNMCAERVVQHLRFHSSRIHQCGECDYLHYTKHVVERHIHDKHPTVPIINLITHDRTETEVKKTMQQIVGKNAVLSNSTETVPVEPATVPTTQSTTKLKWECALCKHQTATWNQMISHANTNHRAKHQYQCVHCSFGSHQVAHIMEHIDAKHPSKTREAKYIFYKINEAPQVKAIDIRPLWSRDDPKRVRNIRGILMENEEEAELTKQSLSNSGVDLDDDEDDIEIVQVIEPESSLKPDILSCFHCEFKCEDMPLLTSHWKDKHWHVKDSEPVPRLPFFFRILSNLKCPTCPYVGDHVLMQLHAFNKHGQRNFCAADPKSANTCGHCSFVYPAKRTEILARHYNREHKPTDVKYLSSGLLKNVLALGECQVYLQCYFCAEIFADKTTIIQHERERHGSGILRYKQIKDEVIYRCAMCQYSSTNELATLRHMIDHFGGFKHCHFCMKDQSSFNAYMQHCYMAHPTELTNFKDIYPLADMKAFLGQMLLIFPNGLIVNKRNLTQTQYGSIERISAMYDEICKKALEPPIPPLCIARLMAKSLNEGSEFSLPKSPAPSSTAFTAKKITKRRSTVAMAGPHENSFIDPIIPSVAPKIKKRKTSMSEEGVPVPVPVLVPMPMPMPMPMPISPAPLFKNIIPKVNEGEDEAVKKSLTPSTVGVSFYGKQSEPIDLSKIYTQISIGDKYAPVSVKKFALLFKMNVKVEVEPMDFKRYERKRVHHFSKPCPASKKKKFL